MQITEVESWLLCRFIAAVFCCQEYTEYILKQTNKKKKLVLSNHSPKRIKWLFWLVGSSYEVNHSVPNTLVFVSLAYLF